MIVRLFSFYLLTESIRKSLQDMELSVENQHTLFHILLVPTLLQALMNTFPIWVALVQSSQTHAINIRDEIIINTNVSRNTSTHTHTHKHTHTQCTTPVMRWGGYEYCKKFNKKEDIHTHRERHTQSLSTYHYSSRVPLSHTHIFKLVIYLSL
eukprot:GHVR01030501.1.p1 GENE.GHVR01030501.1~~GHVR01030501.1.p1  ORF type:complete len:153 (+),score=55.51 GHVR01030501.1:608-1066(+)